MGFVGRQKLPWFILGLMNWSWEGKGEMGKGEARLAESLSARTRLPIRKVYISWLIKANGITIQKKCGIIFSPFSASVSPFFKSIQSPDAKQISQTERTRERCLYPFSEKARGVLSQRWLSLAQLTYRRAKRDIQNRTSGAGG